MKHSFTPKCLIIILLTLITLKASAQLSDQAKQQIQSLMDEKAARTPAQQKISSQLLYGMRMAQGQSITPLVKTLETTIKQNTDGKVKVVIRATIQPKLLTELRTLGVEILSYSERFKTIVANITLGSLEQIANYTDVKAIEEWVGPMNNSPNNHNITQDRLSPLRLANGQQRTLMADAMKFMEVTTRGATVRKQLQQAMKKWEAAPMAPVMGSVTSEGDATHKANLARTNFGIDGTGIKIGVLSDSYNAAAAAADVLAGELPGVGNPNGYTTPVTVLSDISGTDEGRAMLHIIHDLVPGAQLYFATAFNGDADFAQQILDLRAAGCDIIVDDVSYFNESPFQDGVIAQAVNTVTADGALYFSSAGNSGNKNDGTSGTWEGDFLNGGTTSVITNAGTLHNFGDATTPVLFNTVASGGGSRHIDFFWSDPWGASSNDYDVFIVNSAETTVLRSATNLQNGSQNPYEFIGTLNVGEKIYILKKTDAQVRALHLGTGRGRLTISTDGRTRGHNAARDGYSVAATPAVLPGPYPNPFSSSNSVETFSSDGRRRMFYYANGTPITPDNLLFGTNGGEVLQKPDITAADGVMTGVPGFKPFYGTSAAAPHAAAIAGLIKSKFPTITPTQMRSILTSSAIDIEDPGTDRDAGAGIIMAYEAIQKFLTDNNCPTITVVPPATTTAALNQPFSVSFSQSGGTGNITYKTFSTLPSGLSLSSAGVLSGTPTQIGTYTITVVTSQENGCSGNTTYTLTVQAVIINASSPVVVTAENAIPANNAPDPDETITVNLPLINVGNINTTNLVATLQATANVTNPSGPQTYGVVTSGGSPSVTMPFSFTALGNCGDKVTLTLSLQDGALNLGTISYELWLGGVPSTPQTYANTTAITISPVGAASPYPSPITISGISGLIDKVTVTLKNLSHTYPEDLDILLVGPNGEKMIIMSDVGGGPNFSNTTITLDDAAAASLPTGSVTIASGTYKPTDYSSPASGRLGGETYNSPAPTGPYSSPAPLGTATFASVFQNNSPNGTWKLYIMDDTDGDGGSMADGWELTITYKPQVCSSIPTLVAGTVTGSIGACFGSASASPSIQQFTVSGTTLTASVTITPPPNFEISQSAGSGFGTTPIVLTPSSNTLGNTTIYVRSAASAPAGPISGQVTISSTGATSKQVSVSGTIEAPPTVSISPNPAFACIGQTVMLSATAGLSAYSWGKSGGSFSSATNQAQVSVSGSSASSYTFTVSVTSTSTNSCTNTATSSLSVNALPSANINASSTLCTGAPLSLTGTQGSFYSWASSGGTFSSTSSSPTTWTTSVSGVYTITLTTGDGTCTASTQTSVTVSGPNNPQVTPVTPLCAGSTLQLSASGGTSYTWAGPGFSSNQQNPTRASITTAMSGVYSVTIAAPPSTCSTTLTVSVQVTPAVSSLQKGSNSPVCQGNTLQLSASGGLFYSWKAPDGFSSTEQNPTRPSASAAMSGLYSVTVGNGGTCTVSATLSVSVQAAALSVNPSPLNVCIGQTINLSANASPAASAFSWKGLATLALPPRIFLRMPPLPPTSGFTPSRLPLVRVPSRLPQRSSQGQSCRQVSWAYLASAVPSNLPPRV
ncbi:MAG: S8 family serine peptidase [Spirosomataceae bacterium]